MRDSDTTFQTVPESEIDPQIAAVLEPGERVYWQERRRQGGFGGGLILLLGFAILAAWAGDVRDLEAVEEVLREFGDTVRSLWERLPWVFALFALIPIGLAIGLLWTRNERYALTDRRVIKLRRGRIVEQARPGQLMLKKQTRVTVGKAPPQGDVIWANADTFERYEREYDRKAWIAFRNVGDPERVTGLLREWQRVWLDEAKEKAVRSSASFRPTGGGADTGTDSDSPSGASASRPAEPVGASPDASATRRIRPPQHGFSIDVPSAWDIEVLQKDQGALRILGVEVLKRVIRAGNARVWNPEDERPWNHLTVRGGPSVELHVDFAEGCGESMPSEEEVLGDHFGKLLAAPVQFFEKDLEINGFRGFAAVRDVPAGTSATGVEAPDVDVILRQWWLSGHGLEFEISGLAPADSVPLQQTLDWIVASLRPR
jgi:hypothetical protein